MKLVEVTIRGYKSLKRKAFETIAEIQELMKETDIVKAMNAYLGAHPFNSAFEAELVKAAEAAGHKMLTKKSEKSGRDVVIETNAAFLKRTGFTVTTAEAQAIVDRLPWPPEATERGERVDAYTKVATQKLDKALESGKTLEDVAAKLADKGFEPSDIEDKDAVIAAFAEYLRSDDL